MRSSRVRTLMRLVAPITLALGVLASVVSLAPSAADAATCTSSPITAPGNCTMTGTLTLTGGSLQLTPPTSLSWSSAQTGLNLVLVDSTSADQGYTVSDNTGTAAGWHVTVSATTFTSTVGAHTLPDSGTFSTNGSTSSATASTAPSTACVNAGQCTLPTNTTTYPVDVTTAASSPTAYTIFDDSVSTGIGAIAIGGSAATNPVGWWLNVPATAYAGTYTSTITISVVAGP